MNIENVKKWIFITAFVKVGFTLLIEIGIMNFGLSYEQFMNIYAQLDSQPVSMHMEYLGMYRIMTPSDSFPFVALGFLIADKNYSKIIRGLTVISLVCFSLIIYSRIIFLQLALTLFIALILRKIDLKSKHDLINVAKLIGTMFFAIALTFVIFPQATSSIYNSLTYRLFSEETIKSDSIRDIQAEKIFENITESPIIGKGLGYYDPDFTRSDIAPYSYELEYFSFIMQFGILGFILIIIMLIYSFYLMINFNITNLNIKYLLYFNFIFWMVKPLFNPNFLSSNSGSLIATLIILSTYYFNHEKVSNIRTSI
ncbi:O-antigen ligase family protein [Enterococcus sp. LJL98]